jgi:Tol biopolymer transport system component
MDIWVRQLARGTTSRLTFEETDEFNPVWSPDGQRIAYATNHSGDFHVGIRASNGLGVEDTLKGLPIGATGPTNWSRDGSRLLVRTFTAGGNWDVWMASPENAAPPHQVVATQFNDQWARFSPNGQWIAYQSSESGRPEIYVQSANGGGKWQVSTRGGVQAHWRADGAELFYQGLDQMLMAVPISAGATFEAGTPTQLFRVELPATALGAIQWYPSADGKKFIVITPLRGGERPHFTIVTNWASELAKK